MLVGMRKQRKKAGALNSCCELPLVVGFRTCDTTRNDLARFRNVIPQGVEILVINLFYVFGSKPAKPAPSEKSAHSYSALNSLNEVKASSSQLLTGRLT